MSSSLSAVFILLIGASIAIRAQPIEHPASAEASAAAFASCPRIISRAEWRAVAARSTANLPIWPVPFAVIHHTASGACTTQAACAQLVRQFQTQHMNANGWADIGYNFLIGGDGQVYEGRGWRRQGAHAPGFNNQSLGIAFIGNFVAGLPTVAARRAAQQLIVCGVALGQVRPVHSVMGHRQASATQCPGEQLFQELRSWPRFAASPRPFASAAMAMDLE